MFSCVTPRPNASEGELGMKYLNDPYVFVQSEIQCSYLLLLYCNILASFVFCVIFHNYLLLLFTEYVCFSSYFLVWLVLYFRARYIGISFADL